MPAAYPAWPGSGWNAAVDATLSTAPRPRSTMPGRNRVQRSTTATTSSSIIAISASGSAFATAPSVERPGVVDQDLGGGAEGGDLIEETGANLAVHEVGGQHVGEPAGGGDLVGERGELVGRTGHQGDPLAAPGEVTRDLGPDAGGGAGDHSSAVGGGSGKGHAR